MLVSVVIPTTSSELHMAKKCADSVLASTYKDIEVLIINEGLERSAQRNLGIKRAKGVFIMYLDSDQLVSPDLIAECVFLMEQGFNGIFIPEIITTPGWFGRLRNFERSFYNGTSVDCVRFFRKKNCPLFDENLKGPEDADHNNQIPNPKATAKNPLYHHDLISVRKYFKKKIYYSKSMIKYKERWPNDPCLNLKYRCFEVFTSDGKWKRLLCNPIMSIGIFILLFARGLIYLTQR